VVYPIYKITKTAIIRITIRITIDNKNGNDNNIYIHTGSLSHIVIPDYCSWDTHPSGTSLKLFNVDFTRNHMEAPFQ
jgi:hypothetical protein